MEVFNISLNKAWDARAEKEAGKARQILQRGLSVARQMENEVYTHIFQAGLLALEEKYKESLLKIKAAYAIDPQNPVLLREFAYGLTKEGMHKEAIPILGRALDLDPEDFRAACLKGRASYRAGDLNDALQSFLLFLKFNPEDGTICRQVGHIHYQKGNILEAIRWLGRAQRFSEDGAHAAVLKAVCLVKLERYKDAYPAFEEGRAVTSDKSTILASYLMTLIALDKLPQAIGVLERLIALEPKNAQWPKEKKRILNKIKKRKTQQ